VLTQCSLGPASNPRIFLGMARKIILVFVSFSGSILAQGEADQGSVGGNLKVPGCVGVSRRKVANERVVRGKT